MTQDMNDDEDASDLVELNDGHFHEVLDRAWVQCESFQHFLVEHPAVRQIPELRALADAAADAIFALYQAAADYPKPNPP